MRKMLIGALLAMGLAGCQTVAEAGPPAKSGDEELLKLLLGPAPVKLKTDYDPDAPFKVGRVDFDQPVNDQSVDGLIDLLGQAATIGMDSVVVVIDTPGGSVYAGRRLSKVIEESPVKVYCLVDGEADSMGIYLLQSCQSRLMTKRSMLMAHDPSVRGGGGQSTELGNMALRMKTMAEAMAVHICHRSTLTFAECRERFDHGKEWWIGWEEAKSVSMVDLVSALPNDVVRQLRQTNTVPLG